MKSGVKKISRSVKEPRRTGLSTEELWHGEDAGLIVCWEVGRELAESNPEMAKKAQRDELPVLSWKGGVEKTLKNLKKYGALRYLATWQGLRGEDLEIDPTVETELTCSRTGMQVTFTSDIKKFSNS